MNSHLYHLLIFLVSGEDRKEKKNSNIPPNDKKIL
jgi:hypothetical protein